MANWVLNAVRLFVTDIEKAKRFYCDTLNLPLKADGRGEGFLLFEVGPISLVVERVNPNNPEESDLVGRYVGISFSVDDVNKIYNDLAGKGVEFLDAPKKQPWGGTTVSFFDPDKNGLSLVSGLA